MAKEKIKLAIYWGGTCGGCDVAVLDIDENILDVAAMADIVFWPIAMDFKVKDVEALKDGEITCSIYNGVIRNTENEHIAKLLRKKSALMVAFGSCACFGGIPGLANVTDKQGILEKVYRDTASTDNPDFVTPQVELEVPEGKLTLPDLFDTVVTLDNVVDVDYYIPGCPPTTNLILDFVTAVKAFLNEGKPLPPKGTVIASNKTLCDECPREKKDKMLKKIYRPHEIRIDPKECILDQGVICLGPATRAGCGAKCINANMPCGGCMGPTAAVIDQGGSMLAALSSILNITDLESELSEEDILALVSQVKDPLGTFYRFSLPKSLLKRTVKEKGGGK
jgi:F420-non-reducing hydrogenase small subunit